MKAFNTIMKILAALAAIAGTVYVIATYGERIVAWAKKLLGCGECPCDGDCESCDCEGDCEECECVVEAEEAEEAAEEVEIDVPVAEEAAVEADEKDFAND